MQLLNLLAALWLRVRSQPLFVTAYSLLGGALAKSLSDELQSGRLDLSIAGLRKMLAAAVGTAAVALLHLYLPSPQQNNPARSPAAPAPPNGLSS